MDFIAIGIVLLLTAAATIWLLERPAILLTAVAVIGGAIWLAAH